MFRSVTHQMRTLANVSSGASKFAEEVALLIEPTLAKFSEILRELPPMWFAALQISLVDWLESDGQDVLEAERAQRAVNRELKVRRIERDEAKGTLLMRLQGARHNVEGMLGPGSSTLKMGLDPNLGQAEINVLLRYGGECLAELGKDDFPLPTLFVEERLWTPGEYAEWVREAVEELRRLDREVGGLRRDAEASLRVKEERSTTFGKRLRAFARLFEELYSVLGLEFHAQRLRSTRRSAASGPTAGQGEPPFGDVAPGAGGGDDGEADDHEAGDEFGGDEADGEEDEVGGREAGSE